MSVNLIHADNIFMHATTIMGKIMLFLKIILIQLRQKCTHEWLYRHRHDAYQASWSRKSQIVMQMSQSLIFGHLELTSYCETVDR